MTPLKWRPLNKDLSILTRLWGIKWEIHLLGEVHLFANCVNVEQDNFDFFPYLISVTKA